MSHRISGIWLALLIGLGWTEVGHAQFLALPTVRGTAFGLPEPVGPRRPVVGIAVELVAANGIVLDRGETDGNGFFAFVQPVAAGDSFSLRFSGVDREGIPRDSIEVAFLNPDAFHNLSVVVPKAKPTTFYPPPPKHCGLLGILKHFCSR